MDDGGLAERGGKGDRGAFAKLYDRYAGRIYAYHYYRTFSRETAEDLTSQTFLKALEGLRGYEGEKGKFSAWLYGIARNSLIDCVRTRARTVSLDEDPGILDAWDLGADEDFTHDVAERDRWERLKPYFRALDPAAREIIVLRLWDGLSHAEIARLTNRTEAASKMAYSRALTVLRQSMPLALYIAVLIQRPLSGA
jgi:RNA polymerase sigma-70 factor (ECF subfamily)